MDFFERLITALTETHPLHAMIVHFPIAFTAAGFLFMVLFLWKKHDLFENFVFANIVMASLGTLAAGLTGLFDNSRYWEGLAPNAPWKIGLAGLLLVVTAVTAFARWRDPDLMKTRRGLYLTAVFISFPIALVLSFLGGVIVYGF